MKKVIYVGAFRFPAGDAAASRVLNNAKILRALGYKVIFVSWGGKHQESDKGEDGNFYYQGFQYVNTDDIDMKQTNPLKRIYNHFFSGRKSLFFIKQTINTVDIVIGYNPSMFFTNRMLSLCKKYNIPFISDITEWYDSNEFPGGRYSPASWVNDLNMRFTQKKVKNKIVITSFLDRYYKASNNIILPPLVDSEETKWTTIKTVLPPFNGIRLIYAGTPAKKDLLGIILNAVVSYLKRELKLQFVIVGVSKENISNYTNNQEVLSSPNNIIFCGRVPQIDVPSYYNISDFSVIIREATRKNMAGFPTKLAESLLAGVPVIANSTSDIEHYIINGENGLVIDNYTEQSLISILNKLQDLSLQEINDMKNKAKKSGENQFDYRNYSNQVQLFLNNVK